MLPRSLVVALALLGPSLASAQPDPAPSPAATQPAARALAVPPGFKIIEVAARRVVAEEADESWVRQAMTDLAPATRPTTLPADLVEKLVAARPELTQQMIADLSLPDTTGLDPFFEKIIRDQGRYVDLRPPVYYLVTTQKKLLQLVKSGWDDPRYYYNRAVDQVMINTGMQLSVDRPMDDMLLPALYLEDASPEVRAGVLQRMAQQTERIVADEVSRRAQVALQVGFITFIVDEVFRPMGLKTGQDWFGVGASGVLGAGYMTRVSGVSEEWMFRQMTTEPPRAPVKMASIDLINPADLASLREQIVPHYLDAVRRKSTAAVKTLTDKAGASAIAKVIAALRKQLPPDGPALLQLIQAETGVDLSAHVRPAH